MANFVQVMNDWARMCASMQGGLAKCDNCPLFKVLCQYKPDEKVDLAGAEKIIEKWVEDNPAPVYPTWEEWLQSVGVMESSEGLLRHIQGQLLIDGIPAYAVPTAKVLQPMDADIAEKLGIEPIK